MQFPKSLPIPTDVLNIARKLDGAGYEVWCVGGAVRDNLLGHENNDFDLATSVPPDIVTKLFRRTVPIGIDHGTVGVLDKHGQLHEVTTFRRDIKTDGRHAVVEFGVSLEEDLARRDFAINAIAYQPLTHEWRDPFDGAQDLERRLIRAVGVPEHRFREDYLRIVRALRFAARFRFTIDSVTWDAAKAHVPGLAHLSAERVRDEWFKGLETAQRASELVWLWSKVGAVDVWLPELGAACSVQRDDRAARRVQRAAGLVDGFDTRDPVLITSYLSDEPVATLTRLRCSNAEIERGRRITEFRGSAPDTASEVDVRRWLARVGPAADDLLAIEQVDGRGRELADAVRGVRESGAPLSISDLAIGGTELMALGVPQGPAVGQVLNDLLEAALERPSLNSTERMLKKASEIVHSRQG